MIESHTITEPYSESHFLGDRLEAPIAEKTILVVEDNALNMKLVQTVLKTGNHRVLGAMDAETGLQMAREHRPDLILMDIQLPGMDGLEATRISKSDPDLEDIPVIALTSYAMKNDRERFLAAGCDGYITKPIEVAIFLDTISTFF